MAGSAVAKEHRFELVEVGEEFGPREVVVDEARVKAFAFAQDDYNPWHFGDSPFGGPVAHASLLANELIQVYFERYRIDSHEDAGGAWLEEAHVEEELWFERPLPVGETVTVSGRFSDKYVAKGRGAVVLEGEARRADGEVVLRHRAVELFRMDGPAADDRPRTYPPIRRVERPPAAGAAPIEPLEKTVTLPQLLAFSTLEGLPNAHRSVHTDYAIAARAGLPAPLVQGQQLACHAAEAMTRLFGAGWFEGGALRLKFLRPLSCGAAVRVAGAVAGEGAAGSTEVDLWIEDEAGEVVAIGVASGPRLANLPNGRTGKLNRPSEIDSTMRTGRGVPDGN